MPRIVSLRPISSIKVGPGSTVEPDGTIANPEPYRAANISFDDSTTVQVERPLTLARIQAAWRAARAAQGTSLDGLASGADVLP